MLGLDGGDACGVDPAHLSRTDADGGVVLGIDDGVGLDELGHAPGEQQVAHFVGRRLALAHHLDVTREQQVGILHQQPAVDALVVQPRTGLCRPLAAFKQADVLLRRADVDGGLRHLRGDDDLDELPLDDRLRGGAVELAVKSDDAAEGGFGVGFVGTLIGVQQGRAVGHAARVGVLDDDAGGRGVELLHAFQRGVGVADVVVRELLALQLAGGGDAGLARARLDVKRRALVRVFAVAQVLLLDERQVELTGEGSTRAVVLQRRQVVGDGRVVLRNAVERRHREAKARGVAHPARRAQLSHHHGVVGRVGEHGNMVIVLGARAHHGRAADVDVFNGFIERVRLGHGGLEGIEIDAEDVDRRQVVRIGLRHVLGQVASRQQAGMHLGMQGLHPAVEHFRKAGVIGHLGHGQTGALQHLGGAAGGQQAHAQGVQIAGEVEHAGFVGNGNQGLHGSLGEWK